MRSTVVILAAIMVLVAFFGSLNSLPERPERTQTDTELLDQGGN